MSLLDCHSSEGKPFPSEEALKPRIAWRSVRCVQAVGGTSAFLGSVSQEAEAGAGGKVVVRRFVVHLLSSVWAPPPPSWVVRGHPPPPPPRHRRDRTARFLETPRIRVSCGPGAAPDRGLVRTSGRRFRAQVSAALPAGRYYLSLSRGGPALLTLCSCRWRRDSFTPGFCFEPLSLLSLSNLFSSSATLFTPCFWVRVWPCSPRWPGTRSYSALSFRVLGLPMCHHVLKSAFVKLARPSHTPVWLFEWKIIF